MLDANCRGNRDKHTNTYCGCDSNKYTNTNARCDSDEHADAKAISQPNTNAKTIS